MCVPQVIQAGPTIAAMAIQQQAEDLKLQQEEAAAEINADLLEQSAISEIQAGERAAGDIISDAEQLKGAQRAAAAGSGVRVDTGSVADILASTTDVAEADAMDIRLNAARSAWTKRVKREEQLAKADTARAERLGGGLTLLTGSIGTVAEKIAQSKKPKSKDTK